METAVAGGHEGPHVLRSLTWTVLGALAEGATVRSGPLPAGGPDAVADAMAAACGPVLPDEGIGAEAALGGLVRAVAAGAADPSDPSCVAHLHCPPLAVAVAADLAASALNPSMDSWDQAPAAAVLEQRTTEALAALVYPAAPAPDALITSGGTESNLVALLLARERARAVGARPLQVLTGANAHHSVHRAAWMLGLPTPVVVECRAGRIVPAALDRALAELGRGPALVVATAGTTDEGLIDPLPEIAQVAACHGAELHVDAAYGGPLLFSDRLAPRLEGLDAAVSVTFDLHKLGWQPVAAGVLAVADTAALDALSLRADYLNADDDTEAGLPDLLGRSIRTSRRPDALKIAATLQSLGRQGLGSLVEHCVRTAEEFAAAVDADPALRRRPGDIGISTVLFRPAAADALSDEQGDALVAAVRRDLLAAGRAVLGRARAADADGTPRLWLKATLLHPRTRAADLAGLLKLVTDTAGHHRPEAADATDTATPHRPEAADTATPHRPQTETRTETPTTTQAETDTETAAAAAATGSGTVTLAADARPTGGPR
ncbi:aminotransferase class V-fold PLP-dependent enzyme [Streptomyces sp. NPDC006551]|uniref:pyridoxal phosphate-dependent decarboxylase family protein n=1 Tax=Streptomyces sp. NPDC006551 TaxID=3157178 RepID=UPI0033AB3180